MSDKYRLVTRSDFDGLVCAALLKDLDMVDAIKFVHPKDMQDGIVDVSERDITTNLPYCEEVYLAFDHHLSETIRVGKHDNHIIDPNAPSAARVVFDYYGGKEKFPNISDEMMTEVDRADSAQYNEEEILRPTDWVLLNFLMDARTGLGRFRDFRISNYELMMQLIEHCRTDTIAQILELPDVKERVEIYKEHEGNSKEQLALNSTKHDNLVVLDLREQETIYATNRFMIYAMWPACNISIHVLWGKQKKNTVFAVGRSILDRGSKTTVGELMLKYDGGGHEAAGTCQVPNERAEEVLAELIAAITADG